MNCGYLDFCGNNVLWPSWYIMEILSNIKGNNVNEYRLKPCMLLINAGCFVSGSSQEPDVPKIYYFSKFPSVVAT